MQDCRVVLAVRDGRVRMEGANISMAELTELCGVLQVMAGKLAMERGLDIEDVKDHLLDVHLAAMRGLEGQGMHGKEGA